MEFPSFDDLRAAWEWIGHEALHFGVRWLVIGALAVLGVLIFGRGYKRRIAALEKRAAAPAITQTFNFNISGDMASNIQAGMEGNTVRNLRETMRSLPQKPLVRGYTYAELPTGTKIVSMADGSYRLGLPTPVRHTVSVDLKGNVDDS